MKFTLIFGYRNREKIRVKRCLDSLDRQTSRDFEVIFVDYGSDAQIAEQIQPLVESYSFAQYIYNDTRGRNWNRSHALNTGIRQSTGEFTVTTDVDLIYPAHFIETLATEADESKLLHGLAYYMPESFKDYESIDNLDLTAIPDVQSGLSTALGLCQVVSTSILKSIGGFDEFFRIWGVEDLDVNKRLKNRNTTMQWLDIEKYRLVHQWHPSTSIIEDYTFTPLNWHDVMWNHYEQKEKPENPDENWGHCFSKQERSALQMVLNQETEKLPAHKLKSPVEYSMNEFIGNFYSLQPGEAIRIYQQFAAKTIESTSKAGNLTKTLNSVFKRIKTSYRLVNYQDYEKPSLGYYNLRDLIFYFVLCNPKNIKDYYLNFEEDSISAIFVRA